MNKPASQSLTIWSAIATGVAALGAMWGLELQAGEVELLLSSIAVVVGTATTIWGRIRAK